MTFRKTELWIDMKTFSAVLFAICIFSQLASSVNLDGLDGDSIGEVGDKLDVRDQVMLSMVSPEVRKIFRASPKKVLAHVVNSEKNHKLRTKMLLKIGTSKASSDAFVVEKSKNISRHPGTAESVKAKLSKWKNFLVSKTKSGDEHAVKYGVEFFYSESDGISPGTKVSPYALWNRYSPPEIAACLNEAHDKVVEECFVDGNVLEKCSVYYFACGFELSDTDRCNYY